MKYSLLSETEKQFLHSLLIWVYHSALSNYQCLRARKRPQLWNASAAALQSPHTEAKLFSGVMCSTSTPLAPSIQPDGLPKDSGLPVCSFAHLSGTRAGATQMLSAPACHQPASDSANGCVKGALCSRQGLAGLLRALDANGVVEVIHLHGKQGSHTNLPIAHYMRQGACHK